jgi:hypothetical protein
MSGRIATRQQAELDNGVNWRFAEPQYLLLLLQTHSWKPARRTFQPLSMTVQ